MKGLFAISLGESFVKLLVEGLIAKTASNPISLAHYLVILPTRRGCLALHDAFLAATPSGCRILPRILALADIEDGADLPGYSPPESFPPAMPTWQRLGLLSQLVLAFEKQKEGSALNPAGAIRLAQELMRLVDDVETTALHLNDLKSLVGADYAAHWQLTLDFLKILTDLWPPILEQAGFMEPAARKRMILEQVAEHWKPVYPVVLAGTTGTRPSTARLAKSILNFENGCVVLPGMDQSLSLEDRQSLPPTHPQYTLNQLIQQLGMPAVWPACSEERSTRSIFLSKAMAASPQEDWRIDAEMGGKVLSDIQAIEAHSILEEARQIALIMRYELEVPDQVIALVSPDVELCRRVRSELRRWECHANLSSGLPLSQSLVGRFLLLSSQLTQEMRSADLLALLKHPLFSKGGDRLQHLRDTRRFELDMLRGVVPRTIQTLPFPGHELCGPLFALNDGKLHSLKEFLIAHATVAQDLVSPLAEGTKENPSLLWGEEDGRAASTFWETLLDHADSFPPLRAHDYPAFLGNLMAQEIVRDVEGIGSRLLILGALEARLLQADVVILGGLNEGTWPRVLEDDPWLSRSMRDSFGLPPLERKIGLSAHDFTTAMSAPKVFLTRSIKRDGAPTLPSRWWQRLSALLATDGRKLSCEPLSTPWATWSKLLDKPPELFTFLPPAPCPPLAARPRRLSVTAVETLLRDPYSIYAKAILNLRPIDPLDMDLSMAERGQAIHQVLDRFVQSGVDPASPEAMALIESLGREAFGELLADPRAAFWWPRFQRMGAWFLSQMTNDQPHTQEIKTEIDGGIEIPTANGPIALTAKADRIDILTTGGAQIIDYKTGMVPSKTSVKEGTAPQLTLEGVILTVGGFASIPPITVERLSYWGITGGTPPGEITSFGNPEELLTNAKRGVRRLFEAFFGREIPFHACPNPKKIPAYHDYGHLERLKEWA